MSIPKKVSILGQDYKIILCQTEKEFLRQRDADKTDLGLCCKLDKEIWLNIAEHDKYKYSEIRLKETLLHEIFHAVFEESGLSYGINEVLEEIIVDVFSKVVTKLPEGLK